MPAKDRERTAQLAMQEQELQLLREQRSRDRDTVAIMFGYEL